MRENAARHSANAHRLHRAAPWLAIVLAMCAWLLPASMPLSPVGEGGRGGRKHGSSEARSPPWPGARMCCGA